MKSDLYNFVKENSNKIFNKLILLLNESSTVYILFNCSLSIDDYNRLIITATSGIAIAIFKNNINIHIVDCCSTFNLLESSQWNNNKAYVIDNLKEDEPELYNIVKNKLKFCNSSIML